MIMKKILMFMAIMIAVVSLSSCGSLENNEDCLYSYKSSTKNKPYNYKSSSNLESLLGRTNKIIEPLNIYNKAKKQLDDYYEAKKQLDDYCKAKKQLDGYYKAKKQLDDYNIINKFNIATNEKVIVLNDSMCTISFINKRYNSNFELYSQSRIEYTLVKLRKGPVKGTTIYSSMFLNVDYESKKSIQKTIDYIDNGISHSLQEDVLEDYMFKLLKKTYDDNIKKGMSKEDAKANCLYIRAIANSDTYGKNIVFKN